MGKNANNSTTKQKIINDSESEEGQEKIIIARQTNVAPTSQKKKVAQKALAQANLKIPLKEIKDTKESRNKEIKESKEEKESKEANTTPTKAKPSTNSNTNQASHTQTQPKKTNNSSSNKNTVKKATNTNTDSKTNSKPNTNTHNSKNTKNTKAKNKKAEDSDSDDDDFACKILPGQKYATPPKGDPVRAFYESMLRTKPHSEMALKYCVEYGCLSEVEAKAGVASLEKSAKARRK